MSPSRPSDGSVEWLCTDGPESDVVMSSRVRLARNVAGFPFLRKASRADRRQVLDIARHNILDGTLSQQMMWIDLTDTNATERSLLVERHLISKQHAQGDEPRAVAVSSPDERLSIMVNEEDHLRVQVMRRGFALSDAFEHINVIDDEIESKLDYAFCPRFGYLTACPTNVGAGIRISVMLHLPGLKLSGDLEKVRRAAKGMSLAVRGFYGEGSDAAGDIFQLSNQTTLGKSERDMLRDFESQIVPKIIEYERHARRSLLANRKLMLEDRVCRALGTLRHARLLAADEAMTLLGHVRLGITMGLLEGLDLNAVCELLLSTQPAHLQRIEGRTMNQAERRIARAEVVRLRLAERT